MKKSVAILAMILVSMFAIACGKDETAEAPAATTTVEQPGTASPADVAPMTAQTWIDDVTIGSELAQDGSMVTGKTGDDFAPGQAINLSMEVGDAPANSQVKVVWYGPNETKIGEDTKPVTAGQKYLSFTSADTATWAKGDYRAEIWVGDEKVNQQQFQIVDANDAAN
jgi:outer membrane lipoprotein-sorting protein